jgi:glycine hydroxymethyltransferase
MKPDLLAKTDPEVFEAITKETNREHNNLELIASENFCSEAVLAALGSVLSN